MPGIWGAASIWAGFPCSKDAVNAIKTGGRYQRGKTCVSHKPKQHRQYYYIVLLQDKIQEETLYCHKLGASRAAKVFERNTPTLYLYIMNEAINCFLTWFKKTLIHMHPIIELYATSLVKMDTGASLVLETGYAYPMYEKLKRENRWTIVTDNGYSILAENRLEARVYGKETQTVPLNTDGDVYYAVNDLTKNVCEEVAKTCPNVIGAKYSYPDK